MIQGKCNNVSTTRHYNKLGYYKQKKLRRALLTKNNIIRGNHNQIDALNAEITPGIIKDIDLVYLKNAASLSITSKGLTQPHPFSGCIIVSKEGNVQAQTFKKSQCSESSENQAIKHLKGEAEGSTVYLNLETGEYNGDNKAVEALIKAKVSRVIIGIRHPMALFRNKAISELQKNKIKVIVLSDHIDTLPNELKPNANNVLLECLKVNEALLHLAMTNYPMSILKYAMTLDGKIATSTGHASWITEPISRQQVYKLRSECNAVIIGGQTQRRDNPKLTTRSNDTFVPTRIVLSKTLNLLNDANLWDVKMAPTIVMTQKGARSSFQAKLRDKGVQVVECDFLSPKAVAEYCAQKGFLQCLWECGGRLAAPAIAEGVIHKVMAFVAPKIIGGNASPSPCGDLSFEKMTQALPLVETTINKISNDLLIVGYLPSSGGLMKLENELSGPGMTKGTKEVKDENYVYFYKTWDEYGILSNFTAHEIWMRDGKGPHHDTGNPSSNDKSVTTMWPSVENYYQAQKFEGVNDKEAENAIKSIKGCEDAEAAAKIGRNYEILRPELIRKDWLEVKKQIMYEALMAKFTTHETARSVLMGTGERVLVEDSPDDYYWGIGHDGSGENNLGKLLMEIRKSLK